MPPRVLIVDDEPIQRKIVGQQLSRLGVISETAATAAEALEILQAKNFDVVLLDVQMDGISGLEALPQIRQMEDAPEVVMLTLDQSLESGIAAMRSGAYDYLVKPVQNDALDIIIRKAAEKHRLVRQNSILQDFVKSKIAPNSPEIIQESLAMKEILEQVNAVARLNSTILITGESGTGKDVVARQVHNRSLRADAAIVTVNCGAMPESLFESEFFGYEKGAFSGAAQTKRGLLEVADGGTLFLDEIGEMPLNLQVKLLRFLESGEFRRVGGTRNLFADVRLIAATNQNLTQAIGENRFRADLYYRLNVIELHIPPLRERRDDVSALIDYFLGIYRTQFRKSHLKLSAEARQKLIAYEFPGNVRELKNIIERAAALATNDFIESGQIYFQKSQSPAADSRLATENAPFFPASELTAEHFSEDSIVKLDALERRYILSIINFTKGNRERAAELLGISERTLYRRLRDYE